MNRNAELCGFQLAKSKSNRVSGFILKHHILPVAHGEPGSRPRGCSKALVSIDMPSRGRKSYRFSIGGLDGIGGHLDPQVF